MYIWDVNGERLELTSEQLMDQKRFNRVCFERLDIWPILVKDMIWRKVVTDRLENIEMLDAPEDASRPGRIWQLLEEFCSSRIHGDYRDSLLMKKPFTEKSWTYFRLVDFMEYMENHRVRNVTERDVWMIFRKRNARHGRWNIKNHEVKWWAVPEFPKLDHPLDVPSTKRQSI